MFDQQDKRSYGKRGQNKIAAVHLLTADNCGRRGDAAQIKYEQEGKLKAKQLLE